MKKIMITATLIAAALNIVSCNPKELLKPGLEPAFVVIDGDTVKTRDDKAIKDKIRKYDKVGLLLTTITGDTILTYKAPKKLKPAKLPDLTVHKNTNVAELKGKPFKMISAGGNLMQGMRDGGIFNEGMLTAYPNLIANQMGIDFNSALFDANEYNGLGRKVATSFNPTAGPVPKQKEVTNNLAIENGQLKKYLGFTDNYYLDKNYINNSGNVNSKRLKRGHFNRENDINEKDNFSNSLYRGRLKFDFIIFENGLQDILDYEYIGNGDPNFEFSSIYDLNQLQKTGLGNKVGINEGTFVIPGSEIYSSVFKLMVSQGLNKGVIVNCPDLLDLPLYSNNYRIKIEDFLNKYQIKQVYGIPLYSGILTASPQVDSILSSRVNLNSKPGLSESRPFSKSHFYTNTYVSEDEINIAIKMINEKNQNSKILGQYAKMPVFDLNGFYKNILKGGVITFDGVKVDGRWPGGNFFSLDGVYPTAFGQAVLANEVIKTMNSFYKMDVPLIPCAEYLK
jgi:hypothetical protein